MSASNWRSSTFRAKKPTVSRFREYIFTPSRLMAFHVGLNAKIPLNEPGRIVLPPVWEPSAIGAWKSATAAADPDDDPPGVRVASCGFRVFGPVAVDANSVVVVFPVMMY
ncbi:hypothetical protein PC116_g32299 [Phytophthora cactorum]|nr:hypothetical protein PC116_g32299 [Phytophthora cactorum]